MNANEADKRELTTLKVILILSVILEAEGSDRTQMLCIHRMNDCIDSFRDEMTFSTLDTVSSASWDIRSSSRKYYIHLTLQIMKILFQAIVVWMAPRAFHSTIGFILSWVRGQFSFMQWDEIIIF